MGPKRLDDPRPALASVPDAKALFDQGASHATTGLVLLFSSVGLDGAGVVLFAVGAALLSVPLLVAAGAVMLTSVLLILAGNGLLQAARREVFDSLALFDRALLEKARREVLEANPEPSPAGAILMTF